MIRFFRTIWLVLRIWSPINAYKAKRCKDPLKYDPFDTIDLRTAIEVAKIVWEKPNHYNNECYNKSKSILKKIQREAKMSRNNTVIG